MRQVERTNSSAHQSVTKGCVVTVFPDDGTASAAAGRMGGGKWIMRIEIGRNDRANGHPFR
jgi:hypothetical protein